MVVFRSPHSNRTHSVKEYDMDDFVLPNARTKEKQTRNVFRLSALTKKGWNRNVWSTREDRYDDRIIEKKNIRALSERHKRTTKPKKWRNW